jgi:hypothetical protein
MLRPVAYFSRQLRESWHQSGKKLFQGSARIFGQFARAKELEEGMKRDPVLRVNGNRGDRFVYIFGKNGGEAHNQFLIGTKVRGDRK